MIRIPFNKPSLEGGELKYIKEAVDSGKISGDGVFSKKCSQLLEKKLGAKRILLTPSGTAALDMSSSLLNIKSGDEIITTSFTFTSTVNAFVEKGAKPVFVDIRQDTLNLEETLIESKITNKTKAIYCMHYAGVACELEAIAKIARKHKLLIVEDAAQALGAKYNNKYLGTFGDLAAFSFHETKNFNCGEGGALVINNHKFIKRAEIIREKGTNRSAFFRGEVDKYTWTDIGSSYLLGDVLAAYLYAQLLAMEEIISKRKKIYMSYLESFKELEIAGKIILPKIPENCTSNYHQFHIVFNTQKVRDKVMKNLKSSGILAVFHYLPLHASPMGKKIGYKKGELPLTESLSSRLLRLPLYNDMTKKELYYVQKTLKRLI